MNDFAQHACQVVPVFTTTECQSALNHQAWCQAWPASPTAGLGPISPNTGLGLDHVTR